LEAALIGVPDDIFGEEGKAIIVPKPGEKIFDEDIRAHCRKHLAKYKVPKYVDFVESLPRNPGGKVLKSLLG
jgi:acyl-CoA synthetase (AMP-forming)/AMP-acid ligase II